MNILHTKVGGDMKWPEDTTYLEDRELEAVAMNIVHQIGDALYDALPEDVAHDHFVNARQATNDVAIEFAKKLIKHHTDKAVSDFWGKTYKFLHSNHKDTLEEWEAEMLRPHE